MFMILKVLGTLWLVAVWIYLIPALFKTLQEAIKLSIIDPDDDNTENINKF